MRLFRFFLLWVSILGVVACNNSSEEVETLDLSGQVTLADNGDLSNIKVAAYHAGAYNSALSEVKANYPFLGSPLTAPFEFDYRSLTPQAITTTNAVGSYIFSGLTAGEYHLVFYKDGYSLYYLYNYVLADTRAEVPAVNLKRAVTLSETITENYVFSAFTSYFIDTDLTIVGNVVAEEGAKIFLTEDKKLDVYGSFTLAATENAPVIITSAAGIGNFSRQREIAPFRRLYISQTGLESRWHNFVYSEAEVGLTVKYGFTELENGRFHNILEGVNIEQGDSVSVKNCTWGGVSGGNALAFSQISGGYIKNSIVFDAINGFETAYESSPLVKNNYIRVSTVGITITYDSSPTITHNNIGVPQNNGNKAIYLGGRTYPEITYNILSGYDGIYNHVFQYGYMSSNPVVHYNNLDSRHYAIYTDGNEVYANNCTINAENNYFNSTSYEEISQNIYDENDVEQHLLDYVGTVDFEPFALTPIPTAGPGE